MFAYTLNALTLTGNPKDMPKITKAMQTFNKFDILNDRDFKTIRTRIQETMKRATLTHESLFIGSL